MAFKIKDKTIKGEYSQRGSEMLTDLRQQSISILSDIGLEPEKAEQLGNELVYLIASNWGGQLLYVGMGYEFLATARDRQIFNEFNGHNQSELAKNYGLCTQHVYKIIKRMYALERKKNQPDLFGDDI